MPLPSCPSAKEKVIPRSGGGGACDVCWAAMAMTPLIASTPLAAVRVRKGLDALFMLTSPCKPCLKTVVRSELPIRGIALGWPVDSQAVYCEASARRNAARPGRGCKYFAFAYQSFCVLTGRNGKHRPQRNGRPHYSARGRYKPRQDLLSHARGKRVHVIDGQSGCRDGLMNDHFRLAGAHVKGVRLVNVARAIQSNGHHGRAGANGQVERSRLEGPQLTGAA